MPVKRNRKNCSVEILRIALTLIIVYYHLFRSKVLPVGEGNPLYDQLSFYNSNASLCVDCFLVIGGFFLYKSLMKSEQKSFIQIALGKIIRLWPVLFFSDICEYLLTGGSLYRFLMKSLFLQCIGLTKEFTGISWYVSPYFWAMMFYIALNKVKMESSKKYLFIAVLVYFAYVININNTSGGFGRGVVLGFLDLSLLRAVGGFGTGILTAKCTDIINGLADFNKLVWKIIAAAGQIGLIVLICTYLLFRPIQYTGTHLVLVIFVCIFLMLSFLDTGNSYENRLLQLMAYSGKYCYSIYLMQQTAFYIIAKVFMNSSLFHNSSLHLILLAEVLFCCLTGIVTYYLVEKPAAEKADKWLQKASADGRI